MSTRVKFVCIAQNSSDAYSIDNVHTIARLNEQLKDQAIIIQPFLPSINTRGEISLVYIDNEFSHAIVKKPRDGSFLVQGAHKLSSSF